MVGTRYRSNLIDVLTGRDLFARGIGQDRPARLGCPGLLYTMPVFFGQAKALKSGAMVVRFEHVEMRYGDGPPVLRDVSFTLAPGSFHFLIGPSGAGKTTLLRLMYLARRPRGGTISLFGQSVASLDRRALAATRRRIGVVFQEFRLLDHLSALDNVALPLRIAGWRMEAAREQCAELLAWVGLGEHLDAYPATLSGGQQQRVAIARAVIARPQLILADEPTGNVDDRIALRLIRLFEELNRIGTTVLIATHNLGLVERLPHPVLHVGGGSVTRLERITAAPAPAWDAPEWDGAFALDDSAPDPAAHAGGALPGSGLDGPAPDPGNAPGNAPDSGDARGAWT